MRMRLEEANYKDHIMMRGCAEISAFFCLIYLSKRYNLGEKATALLLVELDVARLLAPAFRVTLFSTLRVIILDT